MCTNHDLLVYGSTVLQYVHYTCGHWFLNHLTSIIADKHCCAWYIKGHQQEVCLLNLRQWFCSNVYNDVAWFDNVSGSIHFLHVHVYIYIYMCVFIGLKHFCIMCMCEFWYHKFHVYCCTSWLNNLNLWVLINTSEWHKTKIITTIYHK